jgi:hypothetical protein
MKMNWGTGITLVIVLFVVSILSVVFMAMNERVDLVRDDYYDQELRHQSRIEEVARTQAQKFVPTINILSDEIVLTFPMSMGRDSASGSVLLYRPSDRTRDVRFALVLNPHNTQAIPTRPLIPGLWRVKVEWMMAEKAYYHEEAFIIP